MLKRLETANVANVGVLLGTITGVGVYNTSRLTLKTILADPAQVAGNLRAWIAAFDPDTRDVIEKFAFDAQIGRHSSVRGSACDRQVLACQVSAAAVAPGRGMGRGPTDGPFLVDDPSLTSPGLSRPAPVLHADLVPLALATVHRCHQHKIIGAFKRHWHVERHGDHQVTAAGSGRPSDLKVSIDLEEGCGIVAPL